MRARKRGGRWIVWIDAAELADPGEPDEPERAESAQPDEPDTQTGRTGNPVRPGSLPESSAQTSTETELRLLNLVEKLQEENRNLAGQLGFREAQLQQAAERIRLLEAGPPPAASSSPEVQPEEPEEPEEPEPLATAKPVAPARPWWRFWE
jgi:hypothetical protein